MPCTYGTDLDGNVTGRSCTGGAGAASTNLYWSADGRLDSADVGGTRMVYRYDAAGKLVRRDSAGAVVSWFLWNGDDLLAELSADGSAKIAEYSYYAMDNLHAVILGTTPYYAHTDAVGNIRGYTRASTRYGTYTYDEFGRLLPGGASAFAGVLERPHWKGALWMEPGADLYFMRNRWYEPFTGRFLSEDPIGLAGGLNPYSFAGNEPLNRADPTGLAWCWMWDPANGGHYDRVPCTDGRYASLPSSEQIWMEMCRVNGNYCWDLGTPRNSPAETPAPPPPPQLVPVEGPSCTGAWIALGMAAVDNVTFFTGAYGVWKATRVAARLGSRVLSGSRAALRRAATYDRARRQLSPTTRGIAAGSGMMAFGVVVGATTSVAYGDGDYGTGEFLLETFVPPVAAFNAFNDLRACQRGQ